MPDRFDLTPVDHDPFEAMGAIPGLMPKPNALQAGPTSLQGNPAGLGLPAGVLAKYVGEQVDNAYSMATLPGDVALGRTDPNSEEGRSRAFGLAMGLAGGPLASPRGGVRMGFGGATATDTAYLVPSRKEIASQLIAKGHKPEDAHLAASLAHSQLFEDQPLNLSDYKEQFQGPLQHAFEIAKQPYTTDAQLGLKPSAKPLDHSYWGNEVLSAIHDGLPPDQAVAHVKDLAPDSSHAAIDAAAKEYVPHAVELMKQFSADEVMGLSQGIPWAKAYPELSAALPGVKKFLGIEEPKPNHTVTPIEHDPFAGTVPPVDMTTLYGGLSMDPAARMERARELGFNPDQVLYHGRWGDTFRDNAFRDPAFKSEKAIFLTDKPEIAHKYASDTSAVNMRGEIMPLLARMQNPYVVDMKGTGYGPWMEREIADARLKGHDSIIIHNMKDMGGQQTQYGIFDPKDLRSKFAAFNPAYRDSANLLSTRGSPFALTPVDHDPWEQR